MCHFGTPHTFAIRPVFALSHAKSNYSRTSTKCARKSNYSRTYAKTGGWGLTFELSTFDFEPFFSAKFNHSRTSETFSRKSNYSRTYAKTGGWRPSKQMIFSTDLLRLSSSGNFNRLEKCVPNCELSTGRPVKDAHPERVRRGGQVEGSRSSLSPLFTATSINIVGAPTFSSRRRQWRRRK